LANELNSSKWLWFVLIVMNTLFKVNIIMYTFFVEEFV
jgi:hypothetical protein